MHTSALALVLGLVLALEQPPPDWCFAASLVSAESTAYPFDTKNANSSGSCSGVMNAPQPQPQPQPQPEPEPEPQDDAVSA